MKTKVWVSVALGGHFERCAAGAVGAGPLPPPEATACDDPTFHELASEWFEAKSSADSAPNKGRNRTQGRWWRGAGCRLLEPAEALSERVPVDGRGWVRTSDLSRVRRALSR